MTLDNFQEVLLEEQINGMADVNHGSGCLRLRAAGGRLSDMTSFQAAGFA